MEWLNYVNQGATRNQPIAPELAQALGFLPEMGITMDVFSGGQPAQGSGGARVGSVRHDHGNSADVFFNQNGRRLDWANPDDVPIYQDIVRRARANGVTGFGAGDGYMQPGSMHIGFGTPAVWGAGGRGANAPGWLSEAYKGARVSTRNVQTPSTENAQARGILSNEGNQMDRQPQGLLGSMGIQRRDPNAQGETSQPFYNRRSFGDTLARIAPALGRMGVMGLEGPAQAALDTRNERQGDERAQQAQAAQRNQTREWISSQPNGDQYAAMFDAVGGPATLQAMQADAQGADAVRGINVDGNLVNPVTGELMFAAGNGGASPSSAIAKLQADLSAGLINQEQYDLGLSNMAPSGMRIVSDGRGGFTMEQGSAVGAEDGRMSPSDPQAMIDSIDGILNDPALDRSTGLFSAMQNIPGTDQYRFGTRARQLEGQAFLQAFESLKGAGQITEVEGTKATQAVGRMDTALQADDYREALNDLRSILTTAQARGAAMQSPDGNAAAPAGARIRYDAEGNRL
jgi:hypothetical protein